MKKLFFGIFVIMLVVSSCSKDPYDGLINVFPSTSQSTQNSYDDQAIQDYLQNNYINSRGRLSVDSTSVVGKDTIKNTKLADMKPVTLSDGTVYIKIPNAQPTNGSVVDSTSVLSLQMVSLTARAIKQDKKIQFANTQSFVNTVDGGGVPALDPQWFYVKNSVIDAAKATEATTNTPANLAATFKSYYEIPGFKEAIQNFQGFDLPVIADYSMQGIIIVPSRNAFGKRQYYYNYTGQSLNDYCFIFNFQIYKSTARTSAEQ